MIKNLTPETDKFFAIFALIQGQWQCRTCVDVGLGSLNCVDFWKDLFVNIIAFEPNPHSFEEINSKLLQHKTKYKMVNVFNVALSDSIGKKEIHINRDDWKLSTLENQRTKHWLNKEIAKVNISILDNFKMKHVDFIKIDAENHDDKVLVGSKKTIQKHKPLVYVEHFTKNTKEFFFNNGYLSFVPYNEIRLGLWGIPIEKKSLFDSFLV